MYLSVIYNKVFGHLKVIYHIFYIYHTTSGKINKYHKVMRLQSMFKYIMDAEEIINNKKICMNIYHTLWTVWLKNHINVLVESGQNLGNI